MERIRVPRSLGDSLNMGSVCPPGRTPRDHQREIKLRTGSRCEGRRGSLKVNLYQQRKSTIVITPVLNPQHRPSMMNGLGQSQDRRRRCFVKYGRSSYTYRCAAEGRRVRRPCVRSGEDLSHPQ